MNNVDRSLVKRTNWVGKDGVRHEDEQIDYLMRSDLGIKDPSRNLVPAMIFVDGAEFFLDGAHWSDADVLCSVDYARGHEFIRVYWHDGDMANLERREK